jgi:hypothetical protein
LCFFDNF